MTMQNRRLFLVSMDQRTLILLHQIKVLDEEEGEEEIWRDALPPPHEHLQNINDPPNNGETSKKLVLCYLQ